jgi:hypothetical protein
MERYHQASEECRELEASPTAPGDDRSLRLCQATEKRQQAVKRFQQAVDRYCQFIKTEGGNF